MVHLHNRWLADGYSEQFYRQRMDKFREAFRQSLMEGSRWRQVQHPDKPTKTANQCQRLLDDDPMLWTFLRHPGVPLTNNAAERALRPYVIWRKTSFFSQSFRGDQFRPLILTIVETCKRLGVSAYRIIRQACQQGLTNQKVTVRTLSSGAQFNCLPQLIRTYTNQLQLGYPIILLNSFYIEVYHPPKI